MRAFGMAAFAAAVSLTLATPASAATAIVTFAGTASGTDDLGYFGGGTLTDVAWTATFTYDTTLGIRTTNLLGDSLTDGSTKAVGIAEITVNGFTRTMGTASSSMVSALLGDNSFNFLQGALAFDDILRPFARSEMSLVAIGVDPVGDLETYRNATGDLGSGFGNWSEKTYLFPDRVDQYTETLTQLQFQVGAVEAAISGAPEPSTWAMMILGFGLAGAVLRRRYGVSSEIFQ